MTNKTVKRIFLLMAIALSLGCVKAPVETEPEWKAKFLQKIQDSMSDSQQFEISESFKVSTYKMKGLVLLPGVQKEPSKGFEGVHLYKNDKQILAVFVGEDGVGHGIQIFSQTSNGDFALTMDLSDTDGDGLYNYSSTTIVDEKGQTVRIVDDRDFDGYPETIFEVKDKKALVRINGQMRQIIKKDGKRFVDVDGRMNEVTNNGTTWQLVTN